jgi:endonuclease YncB( thermonuclease family)
MKRNRFALLFAQLAALWLLAAPVPAQGSFAAPCINVSDGDTLTVLIEQDGQKRPLRIRLYGIDAPESKQPFGTVSKKALSDLAHGKTLQVYTKGTDRYGRLLAWLFIGETNLNSEQVRTGLAWWYQKYSPKETGLRDQEALARRGLWADPAPVAPWEWRKR